MNTAGQYFAQIIFRNRILEYTGQQFEDFFVAIMTKSNPNFQAVKAHGMYGDRKNDGFDPTTGTFYQVFSPENITKKKTIADAVSKLESDFIGLYDYWDGIYPVKQYFFVINDRFKGIPAPIFEELAALKANPMYSSVHFDIMSAKDIERIFNSLSDDDKSGIVGFIPNELSPMIETDALHEVITYLLTAQTPTLFAENLVIPDFDKKVSFNGLSTEVQKLLDGFRYQVGQLNRYFRDNPWQEDIVGKCFHQYYEQAVAAIPGDMENSADSRYFYILDKACPNNINSLSWATMALMSFFFSSCDIFEEPQ